MGVIEMGRGGGGWCRRTLPWKIHLCTGCTIAGQCVGNIHCYQSWTQERDSGADCFLWCRDPSLRDTITRRVACADAEAQSLLHLQRTLCCLPEDMYHCSLNNLENPEGACPAWPDWGAAESVCKSFYLRHIARITTSGSADTAFAWS